MKYIVFDLDGTVTESAPGIINSVVHAINRLGLKMPAPGELVKFVGPPLSESFVKYCDLEPRRTGEAIECFREYFAEKGLFENKVYPGIGELTEKLHRSGKTVILATSKPLLFAERILTHFGIRDNFDGVFGNTMTEKYTGKAELLKEIFAKTGIREEDLPECVMIGDRSNDIDGAKGAGIKSVGVLYGYGDREELEAAGADVIVETVADLAAYLLEN